MNENVRGGGSGRMTSEMVRRSELSYGAYEQREDHGEAAEHLHSRGQALEDLLYGREHLLHDPEEAQQDGHGAVGEHADGRAEHPRVVRRCDRGGQSCGDLGHFEQQHDRRRWDGTKAVER